MRDPSGPPTVPLGAPADAPPTRGPSRRGPRVGGARSVAATVVALLGALAGLSLARGGDAPAAPAKPARPAAVVQPRFAFEPCDLALVLSGREGGQLKPCGCSSPQRGGLPRRAALLDDVRKVAKGVAVVSIGDALGRGTLPAQAELKAELFRGALTTLGYDAMLLSPEDLLPSAAALTQVYDGPAGTPRPPRNVMLRASGALAALARVDPVQRFVVDGLVVRAVSVVDPTLQGLLVEEVGVAEAVVPPAAALDVLPREAGLLVVAAHTLREDLATIAAKAATKADLVVVVDVLGEAARRTGEKERPFVSPLLVTFDAHGKEVAVVRLRRREGGFTVAWDPVALDPAYDGGASASRDVVDRLFGVYRRNVRAADLLAAVPAVPDEGPTYVGAAACAPCHAAIVESWQGTAHAFALETLERADYDADPECIGCHVVGWGRDPTRAWQRVASGFASASATAGLAAVQCEACHGPASAHVADPGDRTRFGPARTPGKVWKTPDRGTCASCHDPENSVGFQAAGAFPRYLERVDHREVPSALRTVWTRPGAAPAGPK